MRVIPAIDLIEGRCVRLAQGDFGKAVRYDAQPLEVAQRFEDAGLRYLHLVDLDGARTGSVQNWKTLELLATRTQLHIDFSGGLKTDSDLRGALDSGARQLVIGSVAVKAPADLERWLLAYGPQVIVLSADTKAGRVAVSGWQETSPLELLPFLASWHSRGIATAICTSIEQDGLLAGPNQALYQSVRHELPALQIVASGGVTTLADLEALRGAGVMGAIVGKALYEGRLSAKDLANFEAQC